MGNIDVKNKRIILGLSGGVDSAVAALLLQQAGAEVQALHMTNWEDDDGYCSADHVSDVEAQAANAEVRAAGSPKQNPTPMSSRRRQRSLSPMPDVMVSFRSAWEA